MQKFFLFLTFILLFTVILLAGGWVGTNNHTQWEKSDLSNEFILANQDFAFSLVAEIKQSQKTNENLLISPTSITLALLLAANGAENKTQDEILETIKFANYSMNELNEIYANLQTALTESDHAKINIANSIWVRKGLDLKDSYTKNIASFDAKATELDFNNPSSVNKINRWVKKETKGLIPKMVEIISPDTLALLLNAIYFKADWNEPFDKTQTTERPFYLDDGTVINHPLMFKDGNFSYLEHDHFQAVKLLYEGDRFQAIFILPNQGVSSFIELLNAENWQEWKQKMQDKPGTIYLPQFTFEFEIELKEMLENLGMKTAFHNADFSNMFKNPVDAKISGVKHKSFIEVNEEGTEAAAVTSIEIKEAAAEITEPFHLEFNRPFFFVIEDTATETILFIGEVKNPSTTKKVS